MKRNVHDELALQFSTHRIVRQRHDVPPHTVYEVYVDGQHAVYKHNTGSTGNAAIEGRVMAFVDEHTSVPAPEILSVGDDYYIAAWHPDAPEPSEGQDGDEWADAAGRLLATLHDETDPVIEEYGHFHSTDRGLSIAGHDTWHAAAIAYIRRHRSALARFGHADIADAVTDFLKEHPDVFAGTGGPVCCHGWATPEHVTVADGQAVCIVDFEHAIAAPGEFDYWRTVLPTFTHDTSGLQTVFRAGYESVRSLPDGFERRASLYRLLNGIYYFESLYVQNQHGPAETDDRAERFRDTIFETIDTLS